MQVLKFSVRTIKISKYFVEEAEKDKVKKYASMSRNFLMVPISIKTTGVWGPSRYKFMKELGKLTSEKNKEKRSKSFIMENISMEIQHGNCASVLGTIHLRRRQIFHDF